MHKQSVIIITCIAISIPFHWYIRSYYSSHTDRLSAPSATFSYNTQQQKLLSTTTLKEVIPFEGTYQKRHFDDVIHYFSKKQFEAHRTLYHKYVDKRNELTETLKNASKIGSNKTYSLFRSLKLALTYAANGQILHELFFEQYTDDPIDILPHTRDLIIKSFGSIEAFKQDIFACALSARGWAVCAYGLDDGLLHTYVLEEHDANVPMFVIPLLVIDMYEHAYFIDYATNAPEYIEKNWVRIDWNVIEKRIIQWILPLE
jgi:superoxide dismutase, Fe-Mn family